MSTTVFNIENNESIYHFYIEIYRNVSYKKWFLKDHVTLKTGTMAAEMSALPSQNFLYYI